jgi:hypothetical protein
MNLLFLVGSMQITYFRNKSVVDSQLAQKELR